MTERRPSPPPSERATEARRRGPRRAILAVLTTLAAYVGMAAPALAVVALPHIYWANSTGGSIGTANLFAGEINDGFVAAGATPCGVADDGRHIYWGHFGSSVIGRANLEGKEVAPEFIKLAGGNPCMVAVDAHHVYWSNYEGGGTIGRANLEGKEVEPEFIKGLLNPLGVAVADGHIYWADYGGLRIGRANLEGKEVEKEFIYTGVRACGVAVGDGHIYWVNESNESSIGRANLEGKEMQLVLVPTGVETCGVAVDGQHVYWSDFEANHSIGRANLEGQEVVYEYIGGASAPWGVAVTAAAPTATILAPGGNGLYVQGQVVPTSFTCSEGAGGTGIASCDDSAGTASATGGSGRLNTATPGVFTYTVAASSADGQSGTASIAYAVIPASPVSPSASVTGAPVERGSPVVNPRNGRITVTYEFPEPGAAVEEGEVPESASVARVSAFGALAKANPLQGLDPGAMARVRSKRCPSGAQRRAGRCMPNAPVSYGRASLAIPAAGVFKLTIAPTPQVLRALRRHRTLRVRLALDFTPAGTTDRIAETASARVHLTARRRAKHR